MNALATTVALLACVVAASTAGAQSNDVSFAQTQGDDGIYHIQIGVSYGFPGLPPRGGNTGVGTVRMTLPGASLTLESVDSGYQCVTESASVITCSSEGLAQAGGTAFPGSMTVRFSTPTCWAPDSGQSGTADVWAAPNDPGSAPDVRLSFPGGGCVADAGGQPVLDTKETCKVPNLKNLTLKAAVRELTGADCRRGKVAYAWSPKVRKGRVMSQSARPGKTLKAGSKVNLIVSRGKKR